MMVSLLMYICVTQPQWVKQLTHWGRVMHTCVGNLTTIGSDNGLSPGRRQAIIWTNAGILLIGPLGTKFSQILITIHTSSFKKMHPKTVVCKMASILSRPQCVNNTYCLLSQWMAFSFGSNCYSTDLMKLKIGSQKPVHIFVSKLLRTILQLIISDSNQQYREILWYIQPQQSRNHYTDNQNVIWNVILSFIQPLSQWSLQNFAKDMTAGLLRHMETFVGIWWPTIKIL